MAVKNKSRGKKTVKSILKDIKHETEPDKKVVSSLKALSKNFIGALEGEFRKQGIGAEAFVGGSFAKNTLIQKENYDLDILVRFDWRYDNISLILEKALKKVCKNLGLKYDLIHGSRDYFRIYSVKKEYYLEVIPVAKIKHPYEAKNVTDLSYFHVPYVRRKLRGLESEVRLAKTFLKANKVYGAETYVSGFSGYAIELLIIYYKSFEKMLRALGKVKIGERLVIDIEKRYKKKSDVFIEMNESKLNSPVILIDPTYKERNSLAALSSSTFKHFQRVASAFLKRPSKNYFVKKEINVERLKNKAKKNRTEFVHLKVKTDRQIGDIAGTKLKKFSEFLVTDVGRYFKVLNKDFEYDGVQSAGLYLIAESRKEFVRIGPPLHMKKFVRKFKAEHADTYEKNKFVHAKIKIKFTAQSYLDVWSKMRSNKLTMREMSIISLKLVK